MSRMNRNFKLRTRSDVSYRFQRLGKAISAAERLRSPDRRVEHAFGFVEAEVPGISVDQVAAGTWLVWLEAAWPEKDPHAFGPERVDAAPERDTAGKCAVDEGQDHCRHGEAGCLG